VGFFDTEGTEDAEKRKKEKKRKERKKREKQIPRYARDDNVLGMTDMKV
jgi:hypothetical protein